MRRYNLTTGEIHTTNAAAPITFDPRAALAPLNQTADALRHQLSQARAASATDFAGMKLLYELFTNSNTSGMYDNASYTYTFPANTRPSPATCS